MLLSTGKVIIMEFEELLNEADTLGIPVTEKPFKTYDGRIKDNKIYLREDMPKVQKKCVLAEEPGHYYTTTGDTLDQQNVCNVKQERRARIWAYDKMINLFGIIRAHNAGRRSSYEIAEYLDVTETFLLETLNAYKSKYGTDTIRAGEFFIVFEPELAVFKADPN